MKISREYPNYASSLLFFIEDKQPVLASDDTKIFSYFIPLANFRKGFDYYELTRHKNGGVYFSLVTMLGFKTIVRTDSEIYYDDLAESTWTKEIGRLAIQHFGKEEYLALKKGYVKKKSGGCMTMLLLILALFVSLINF